MEDCWRHRLQEHVELKYCMTKGSLTANNFQKVYVRRKKLSESFCVAGVSIVDQETFAFDQ